MRLSASAWPTSSSALSRGDSMPFAAKKSVVFLMTSRTVSMSVLGVVPGPCRHVGLAGQRGEFLLVVGLLQGRDDLLDLALHDLGQVVEREPDAVVRHPVLRKTVGADAFAAGARANLAATLRRVFRVLLVLAALQQPGPQDGHGLGLVLQLRALIRTCHQE